MRKPAAWFLTIIVSVLIVQPGFIHFGGKAAYGSSKASCSMTKTKLAKTSCAKMTKCSKSKPVEQKKKCGSDHCNPFLGCVAGNFYVHNYWIISLDLPLIVIEKLSPADDNRLAKQLTECWHPPEFRA